MAKNKKVTKKEFTDILLTFTVGNFVREMLLDENLGRSKRLDSQMDFMLNLAERMGFADLVEIFHGSRLPINSLCLKEEKIIEEYEEQQFWENLGIKLGQRDLYNSLSDKEKEELSKQIWLPEKIHEFYEKYSIEFEENGLNRLQIVEGATTRV